MPGTASIVIPTLNEAPVIGEVVRRLRACRALQDAGIIDIVVVDNGSDDATFEVARAAGARVVREPRRGYGRACLTGVQAANDAEVIILMDGDGSDVPEDIVRVWQPVQTGVADLAMGSRVRGQCERGALTPQQRAGNAVGTALLRWLYGVRVSDIGPLRAIRRETLLRMEMREMTYGWSAEMLAKAGRLGLRVHETPVDYRRRAGGTSKVAGTLSGTIKASARILRTIARYRRWQPMKQKQALFIVARLPIAGQTKTRLGQAIGNEAATTLYRAFLHDLGERFTRAAARDGYDLYWCYAAPDGLGDAAFAAQVPAGGALLRQEGPDFAARLWHGFQTLSARGYGRIVVIGSDSPHLPAAWVAQAFEALATHDVVVGPAQDGGYYLLGQRVQAAPPAAGACGPLRGAALAGSGFPHSRLRLAGCHRVPALSASPRAPAPVDLFSGITMSTATVCAETLARAEAAGLSVALTPATFDIDQGDDLDQLRQTLREAPSALADAAPATYTLLNALPSLPPGAPLALAGSGEG